MPRPQARSVDSWKKELRTRTAREAYEIVISEDKVEAYQAYLALYENRLTSRVMRGENRGRTLEHDFVVRTLAGPFVVAPRGATALRHTFQLHPEWKRGDLHVAAFVQDAASGDVLQALDLAACS